MQPNDLSSSAYKRSNNSFAGADIHATFGGVVIGELQGLSYNITREKAPIYTCGDADPRSFSRGKRGIAGSMVFHVFNREPLLARLRNGNLFLANRYSLQEAALFAKVYDVGLQSGLLRTSSFVDTSIGSADANFGPIAISIDKVLAPAWYEDQIPPFDIVITAANEYGSIAQKSIIGVEIVNVGSGFSVDDVAIDQAMTYVARKITPWAFQGQVDRDSGSVSDVRTQLPATPYS